MTQATSEAVKILQKRLLIRPTVIQFCCEVHGHTLGELAVEAATHDIGLIPAEPTATAAYPAPMSVDEHLD